MKQHITPKQFKEMDKETAIRLFELKLRNWDSCGDIFYNYHHKKVTIGRMIEILDKYSNEYGYFLRINQSTEGYYRVEIDMECGANFYYEEVCDALWQALKWIVAYKGYACGGISNLKIDKIIHNDFCLTHHQIKELEDAINIVRDLYDKKSKQKELKNSLK